MSNEFKLKPCRQGSGHAGQWCGPLFDCWLDPRPRKERDADFESRKAVAMAGQRLVETQPPALGGEPELDCLADIPYANETPADWDPDYRKIWQELQVATRNKSQLRAHLAPLQAEIERLNDVIAMKDREHLESSRVVTHISKERDQLKARNVEQSRLLNEFHEVTTGGFLDSDHVLRLRRDLEALLSKTAGSEQPSDQQGEENYPPCDYCGIVPDYHPWHGSGMLRGVENRHIHACHVCRLKLPPHVDQQGEPAGSECCTPTEEERALLAAGDCTPQELWGGPRPTCPKCIKPAGSEQV